MAWTIRFRQRAADWPVRDVISGCLVGILPRWNALEYLFHVIYPSDYAGICADSSGIRRKVMRMDIHSAE